MVRANTILPIVILRTSRMYGHTSKEVSKVYIDTSVSRIFKIMPMSMLGVIAIEKT
jgi:hypothetical protein